MRRDELYLHDMVEAAEAVGSFIRGVSRDEFMSDDLRRSAVLQKLIVIGEAASRISPQTRAAHPDVPWRDIAAFGNIAVHAYFSIDWNIVWHTAVTEVPSLKRQIEDVISSLETDTEDSEP